MHRQVLSLHAAVAEIMQATNERPSTLPAANLLTGAVNLAFDVMRATTQQAWLILTGYMVVVCGFAGGGGVGGRHGDSAKTLPPSTPKVESDGLDEHDVVDENDIERGTFVHLLRCESRAIYRLLLRAPFTLDPRSPEAIVTPAPPCP